MPEALVMTLTELASAEKGLDNSTGGSMMYSIDPRADTDADADAASVNVSRSSVSVKAWSPPNGLVKDVLTMLVDQVEAQVKPERRACAWVACMHSAGRFTVRSARANRSEWGWRAVL